MTTDRPDFASLAGPYARFRTGYPPAVFDRVLAAAPPGPLRVLDVATGTGLSASGLGPRAARVVGVDVAAPMLRQAGLAHRVLARAEALPFRGGAFDLLTCAQAFHWLDGPAAWAEFHRVLRPGGLAAVWWKYEAAEDPVSQLSDRVVREVTGREDPHTPLVRGGPLPGLAGSAFAAAAEEAWLEHPVTYTASGYAGYQGSREVLRRLAGPRRDEVVRRIGGELRARHGDAAFQVRYRTRLVLLRRGAAAGPGGAKG